MKAWLKGGLIGLIVGIIAIFLYFFVMFSGIGRTCPSNGSECMPNSFKLLAYPMIYTSFPLWGICHGGEECIGNIFWAPLLSLIVYSLIGTLIGFIIGKLKSR